MCLWGKKGKNGEGCSPEGAYSGSFAIKLFSLLQVGTLEEVSGEGFSRVFISSPGGPFQGHGLL